MIAGNVLIKNIKNTQKIKNIVQKLKKEAANLLNWKETDLAYLLMI